MLYFQCFFTTSLATANSYWSESVRYTRAWVSERICESYARLSDIFNVYSCIKDLENYILELIPTLPQLNSLEESFYSFYVCTAVRKFFFFLDPMRTG